MPKKKVYLITIFILILAFFLANLTYFLECWNQSAYWVGTEGVSFPRLPEKPFKLGLDLQGGTHLIYEADLSNIAKEDYSSSMEGLRDVIERRVNLFGVREPMVQVQGERLVVELAGIKDPAEAIKMIGQTPYLEFREQKENYNEILEKNR